MRRKSLKLPNGFGSVIYLGEKRRNSYGAIVTTGWDENGKQIKKYIGYADNYNSAYKLLLEYHNVPFNLDNKNITIDDVYNKLEPIWKEDYLNEKMSKSTYKCMTSIYKNHFSDIKHRKILEIKKKEIQNIIDKSDLGSTGRGYLKIIFTKIIEFCNNELELNINNDICKLNIGSKEKSTKHKVIIDKHIQLLIEYSKYNKIAQLILVYLYTGYRPSELLDKETNQVFLEKDYMIGGLKTEAGKNRIMPIHSAIKPIIESMYNPNNKYLVCDEHGNKRSYSWFKKQFKNLMNELKLDYTPYDTRHTFATKCDELKIPENIIKRLMGHSLKSDITNDVYIHKTVEQLKKEIEKICY